MDRAYSMHGQRRYVYKIVVGNFQGKTPVGRPRHRWEDNIKLDLTGIVWEYNPNSVGSRKGPVVGFCENDEYLGSINAGNFFTS
jgi:hypothetical protein